MSRISHKIFIVNEDNEPLPSLILSVVNIEITNKLLDGIDHMEKINE